MCAVGSGQRSIHTRRTSRNARQVRASESAHAWKSRRNERARELPPFFKSRSENNNIIIKLSLAFKGGCVCARLSRVSCGCPRGAVRREAKEPNRAVMSLKRGPNARSMPVITLLNWIITKR